MSWAQVYDGTDDHSLLDTAISINTTEDFSIRSRWPANTNSGNHRVLGGSNLDASAPRIILFSNGNAVLYGSSGGNKAFSVSIDTSVDRVVEFRRVSGQLGLYFDNVLQGATQASSQSFTSFGTLGGNFGTSTIESKLQTLEIDVAGSPVIALDATVSSHAAGTPILTDTVGGNNATGVNMATGGTVANGGVWLDLGGSGISIAVTEVLNSFVDTSNINIDYNVSAAVTETLNSFGDTSVVSVTSGQVVNLAVTETLNSFVDISNVDVSANIDLIVTEVLNSFLDGSNVTIVKELTLQVTEVFNSFADNSSVKLPANWNDKPKVTTTYTTQTPVSTIWIDKG